MSSRWNFAGFDSGENAAIRFGSVQNRVLTNDGHHDAEEGPVPGILVMFAISMYSACFY